MRQHQPLFPTLTSGGEVTSLQPSRLSWTTQLRTVHAGVADRFLPTGVGDSQSSSWENPSVQEMCVFGDNVKSVEPR
jgi:hypothetical protein